MKTIQILLVFMLISFGALYAQNIKTEKIKVKGSCGMCDSRIEKAAMSLDGVQTAEWDMKLQVLVVKYDETKMSNDKIQKKIAEVGHDTEKYNADDKVYDALPGCCKYR